MNRIIDISQEPCRISYHLNNLVFEKGEKRELIPLKDIAAIVISHPQVVLTLPALSSISMNNVTLVVCDSRYLPSGMMLPLSVHYVQTQVFEIQSRLSFPAKKRIWKCIVQSKITAQARVLRKTCGEDFGLLKMNREVRSGDPTNVEGKAAKRYWTSLFGMSFKRNYEAKDENAMLNYGYALMRGIVARALCASGLHPSLGIHHHHRSNPFALADDFIEPLRPLIDHAVWKWSMENDISRGLTREGKMYLISEFTDKYKIQGQYKTLFTGVNQMASSFVKVCKGERFDISIPSIFGD